MTECEYIERESCADKDSINVLCPTLDGLCICVILSWEFIGRVWVYRGGALVVPVNPGM